MSNEIARKELMEAVNAGEQALTGLRNALDKLNSARSWGLWDMFGGGFLSSMLKHSNMDQASVYLQEADHSLRIFQRELKDVSVPLDIRMEIGDFLAFADFFLDGFFADCMVQSRIEDARCQVEDAISRVENILNELKQYHGEVW